MPDILEDVLRFAEVERPVPKDDEVLIKVHATTVNRSDTGLFRPKRKILGTEVAGEVVAVGGHRGA